MKYLVLSIDRDNDFGRKVGIASPIVGRRNNLRAAIQLSLADPEDSDSNTLFAAISKYDRMKKEGMDVDIATICGDIHTGMRSDQIIAEKLDSVLASTAPDRLMFVSDGAEDEFILPLLSSRIKIDSVERVVVRQSQNLESTFYIFMKFLQDDKMKRRFIIPAGLVLLVLAITSFSGHPEWGWGAVLMTLGVYLIVRGFRLEEPILALGRDFRAGLEQGHISTIFTISATALIVYGLLRGYNAVTSQPTDIALEIQLLSMMLNIIASSLWFIIAGGLIYAIGKTIDVFVREERFLVSIIYVSFALFAMGLFTAGVVGILQNFVFDPDPVAWEDVYLYILGGLVMTIMSIISHGYIRDHFVQSMSVKSS